MASFGIHLAIAKVYLDNNEVEYPKEFLKGVVEPDLVKNKKISHYSDYISEPHLKNFLKSKVNLRKFLEGNCIESDYQKGVFLHLISDYEMYNNYFDKNYIENTLYEEFINNIYYSYDEINDWIIKKYPVLLEEELQKRIEKRISNKKIRLKFDREKIYFQNVFPLEKIDQWIQKIGKTNLEDYKETVLKQEP